MDGYQRKPRIVQRFFGWIVVVIIASLFFLPQSSFAAPAQTQSIADWLHRSFSQLPAIDQSGQVDLSSYQAQLGYDASRTWQAGMTPDQYVKLGDISESLSPGAFTLKEIRDRSGVDWHNSTLAAMPLIAEQTIAQLASVIPGIDKTLIKDIAPIARLLVTKAIASTNQINLDTATVDQIASNPALSQLKLSDLGNPALAQMSLDAIPNIDQVMLHNFDRWENSTIQSIPGLNQVPIDQFPTPIQTTGATTARIDFVFGAHEADRHNTISGSDVLGFQVPCQTHCAHIELGEPEGAGNGLMTGKQWISGKYQSVQGGHGVLAAVNGGKEPTGRLPFGQLFKLAIMEPDESTDTVTTALFFRVCHSGLGCTPYFIGPVPFLTYARDALIFVGSLDPAREDAPRSDSISRNTTPEAPMSTISRPISNPAQSCTFGSLVAAHSTNGIDLDALRGAISGIESEGSGGYSAIGEYVCADRGQNCGRGLGKYQFMNYNPYAANLIAAHPGGAAFLARVENGSQPSADEVTQYFPPIEQDQAFNADLSQKIAETRSQIDPTTGEPFTGDRLIARVAQKHYAGDYSRIDGGQDVRDYGTQAVARYRRVGGQIAQRCDSTVNQTALKRTSQHFDRSKGRIKGQSTGKYSYPINPGQYVMPMGGEFGSDRRFPVPHVHAGSDFSAPLGTPFKAIDGGVVRFAGKTDPAGFGSLIIVRHNDGSEAWYGHPSGFFVETGDVVAPGQTIGRVGSEGDSTGPHLHLELHDRSGQPIDPMRQMHYVRN